MNRRINPNYVNNDRTINHTKSLHREFDNHTPKQVIATPQSRLIALLLDALIFGLGFGIVWLIWFINLADRGTTPGHFLMGQIVVDAQTGKTFGWKRMVVREILVKGVLHWILGSFLFMMNYLIDGAFLFSDKRQTLHDLLLGSTVIQISDKTLMKNLKLRNSFHD